MRVCGLLREQALDALHAFGEVVVAQGIGQAQVAGRAEGLSGHDGDLDLLQDQPCQLG